LTAVPASGPFPYNGSRMKRATPSSRSQPLASPLLISLIVWGGLVLLVSSLRPLPPSILPPFTPIPPLADAAQRLRIWGHLARVLLYGGFLSALTWAWGRRIRSLGGNTPWSLGLGFAVDVALGASAFSLLSVGLGLCGLWFKPLLAALLVLLAVTALVGAWRHPGLRPFSGPIRVPRLSAWGWALAVPAVGAILFALAQALAPDAFYDSLVYHLPVVEQWANVHALTDIPGNLYARYPFGAESFFAWGVLLQGSETAKVLLVFLFTASALGASSWAAEKGGVEAGLLAFACVALYPLSSISAWTLHTEIPVFLDLFLYYVAWERFLGNPSRGWLLTAAWFGGAAAAAKYLAWPWLALGALAAVGLSRGKSRRVPAGLAWVLFLLPILPWTLKNLWATGNPLFPYFSIGAHPLPAWARQALMGDHEAGWILGGAGGPLGWIPRLLQNGPSFGFLLALLPFLALGPKRSPGRDFWVGSSLALLALTACVTTMFRLMLPVHLLALAVVAAGLGAAKSKSALRWASLFVLVGTMLAIPSLKRVAFGHYQAWGIWSGRETPEAYLARLPQTDYLAVGARWVKSLPSGSKVLRIGDARSAYLPYPVMAQSPFDEPLLVRLAGESADPADLALRLRRLGITHLWISGAEGARLAAGTPEAWAMDPAAAARLSYFLSDHTAWVDGFQDEWLVALRDRGPGEHTGPLVLPWLMDPMVKAREAHPQPAPQTPIPGRKP